MGSSNLGTKLYVFTSHLVSLHFTYVTTTRFLMLMFVFVDVSNVQSVCNPLYQEVDMLMLGVFEHFSVDHILSYAVRGCYTVAVCVLRHSGR